MSYARDERPDAETLELLKARLAERKSDGITLGEYRWHRHQRPEDCRGQPHYELPLCTACRNAQFGGRTLPMQKFAIVQKGSFAAEIHYLGQCRNCHTVHWINAGIPLGLAAQFFPPELDA